MREHLAAMDHEIGRAVPFAGHGAEIEQLPGLAGVPHPDFLAGRLAPDRLQSLFETEREQGACAIGGHLDAGTDLSWRGRLFQDGDPQPPLKQRAGRGEAADSGAGDHDVRRGALLVAQPLRLRSAGHR